MLKDELIDIRNEPRYVGTRRGEDFVLLLLKEIIPEIEEGRVQIALIVREEGIKTYVVARSSDPFISAAKSIIGPQGSRIAEIKKQIPERFEIIEFKMDKEDLLIEIFKKNLISLSFKDEVAYIEAIAVGTKSFPLLEIKVFNHFFPNITVE